MKYLNLFLLLLITTLVRAQSTALPTEVLDVINQRVESGVSPGIAVAVIDANGTQYYNFGTTKAGGNAINEHSIFEIGSITKTFTAILLADMVLAGKLNLDDPISKFLPEEVTVPSRGDAVITLGNLSDHTSSLPRMPDNFNPADPLNPYADYTVQNMYDFITSYTLTRDIGSVYEYSNLAQGLLGHILAMQSGKPYEELMLSVIARPLKMTETAITFTPMMKKHLAYPHAQGMVVSNWDLGILAGAGAIRSSAHDMARYVSANLGLLDSELAEAMQMTHQPRHDKNGSHVGLAWHMSDSPEGNLIQHSGGTGGYRTFVGFVKETGRGVVVLGNSDSGVDDIGMHLLNAEVPLQDMKPHIAIELKKHIDNHGAEGLEQRFSELKNNSPDKYDFSEDVVNTLGYYYLGQDQLEVARILLKINTEEYPESSNTWDSYGEVLMKMGHTAEAIVNYKKSLDINPGNANAIVMLKEMGEDFDLSVVVIDEQTLDTYVGNYALFPNFSIEITREGKQLYLQATGQQRFELYASSISEFYLQVVEARVVFSSDKDGIINSMTLFQNGQEMKGMKE